MRRLAAIFITLTMFPVAVFPARTGTVAFTEFSGGRPIKRQVKWTKRRIAVAFSSSLNSPGPSFKLGSDVVGAARRGLSRWAGMADVTFVETSSNAQSVSSGGGDGINLITIADTRENNALFTDAEMTGRTRVFYDPETGAISEADICVNPHPALSDGTPVQFSTDGTPGTYDLESTITHEIGHLLGLDHSAVMASTMQARQGLNGVYGLPSLTGRTLSEEDRERVRSLYGPSDGDGSIEGKVTDSFGGAQVWAESIATGRVVAGSVVADDGSYRFNALVPGQYRILIEQLSSSSETFSRNESSTIENQRLVRAAEVSSQINVTPNATSTSLGNSISPQAGVQFLNPRFIGINGDLSTVALPLEAGKNFKIFVGGEGIDQVAANSISVGSPYFKVNPASLSREDFGTSFPVISFDVSVAANAPFGDYSIRLQSNSGEVAYLAGGITIDPGATSTAPNPVDDPHFFVGQHYRDVLGREADRAGLDHWTGQLQQCGADVNCNRAKRLEISTAFLTDTEVQATSTFVYGLYKTLGRRPTFAEFEQDRGVMSDSTAPLESKRKSLAADFVKRAEFTKKYPASMTAEEFVDAILTETMQNAVADPTATRNILLGLNDGATTGRAAIVARVLGSPGFMRADYNRVFVLMQYFAYLRRDPDEAGYSYWLTALQNKPLTNAAAFRSVSCAFLSSAEYQSRFGMVITHTGSECSK
jgi:hypothetical protein